LSFIYIKIQIYDIYIEINQLNNFFMGCGCKNKANNTNQTPQPQPASQVQVQPQQQSVQEAIKKTIEKYYINKKPSN
jgi:hypothetical protein